MHNNRVLERNNARVSLSLSRFNETTMATIRRIVTRTRETKTKCEQARSAGDRRWREGKRSSRRKSARKREKKRKKKQGDVEKAWRADRSGKTGITRTITWLFLAAKGRALLFSTLPPLLYAAGVFPYSRAHAEYIHSFGFEPQW